VFGDSPVKELAIPQAIDAYNHHMGGVDIANQLRASYTTQPRKVNRYWKPLFYWLLDIAITNAYLLSRSLSAVQDPRAHQKFIKTLCEELMGYTDPSTISELRAATGDPEGPEPDTEALRRPESILEAYGIPGPHHDTAALGDPERLPEEYGDPELYIEAPEGFEFPSEAYGENLEPQAEGLESPEFSFEAYHDGNPEPITEVSREEFADENHRHIPVQRSTRVYCAYCRHNKRQWAPHAHSRSFGTDITNQALNVGAIRGSKTSWNCLACNIALCRRGDCWRLWHESINT